jgi:hypothetical protein
MRLAAKLNAIVVPVGGIGADDVIHVADADELLRLPRIGDSLRQFAEGVPAGRAGEQFVSPITLPQLPLPRYYFCFGKPIDASEIDASDTRATVEAYGRVKAEVQGAMDWLLEKRESDPYGNFVDRIAFEAASNWQRQAPTFRL